ncbi:MAG: aminoacyl-tRNA hydrolase [Eubacteriales bacterium]|nr:aminoacyl-tRNA hydrolase [Eubacteriales bacterium]
MSLSRPKLVVGLGNPGEKYARNWHNLGYMVLDILAERHKLKLNRIRFKGYSDNFNLGGQRVILLKPTCFMNNSGESVRAALDFYALEPEDVIVVYDDIDLDFGTIRIRGRGGAAHHNGMKSVIAHLGTEEFTRVKLGFGPQDRSRDIVAQVLANIPKEQQKACFEILLRAADAVEMIIKDGLFAAQSKLNGPVK